MRMKSTAILWMSTAMLALAASGALAQQAGEAAPRAQHGTQRPQVFFPELLDLSALRQNALRHAPASAAGDYAARFAALDLAAVKADLNTALTTSQDWWPADYGNYGPLFIRMAWHAAGTYRIADGRGGAGAGQIRFEPLNSWRDNTNLDKAKRLLWPIKQKYGEQISWADLMILAGNVALENMGFKTFGFAGGRIDAWEPDLTYWGPELDLASSRRYSGDRQLAQPLGAAEAGLIYVNPEGPNGNPDPIAAARDIRETFGRMAMNDEETVALIAGGHTFGKNHGAQKTSCVGAAPAAADVTQQGLGWKNSCGSGVGADTTTSGLEGAWTASPAQWSHQYLTFLFQYEWKQTRSPAGAIQWIPTDETAQFVPDAHDPEKRHAPVMLTTDLSLKMDPAYRQVSQRFLEEPEAFEQAFARAWFKLTHRDMGPRARYIGASAPSELLIWQDPIPAVDGAPINAGDIEKIKAEVLKSGLGVSELVRTAWASASTYRDTDKRGGANGARIRFAPQRNWAANDPAELSKVLTELEKIRAEFNKKSAARKLSMADLIVLAGNAAVEKAAKDAGLDLAIAFAPGRADALEAQTDAASFAVLEPKADGFRNYMASGVAGGPAAWLVEKADLLGLTVAEMTVLVGGLRALNANAGSAAHGVLTKRPGQLSNDFFLNLLSLDIAWRPATEAGVFEGVDRKTGARLWTATEADLIFGHNGELRAVAEYYAYDGAAKTFAEDFAKAWTRVMNADRFDLK